LDFTGLQLVDGTGVSWASVPTPPRDEGVIEEIWGFIGVREGVGDGKAFGNKVGSVSFVGANVGFGDKMKGALGLLANLKSIRKVK
jgi:hypothetical protein